MNRVLGIVLDYPPETLIKTEGLSRLLMFLIQGCKAAEINVEIICSEWCHQDLEQLFIDSPNTFRREELTIISTESEFPLLLIYTWFVKWTNRIRRPSKIENFFKFVKALITDLFFKLMSTKSWSIFIIAAIGGLFLIPALIIFGSITLLVHGISNFFIKYFAEKKKSIALKIINQIGAPLQSFKDDAYARELFKIMDKYECKKIAELAHKHKHIHTWLLPTPYWPELVKMIDNTIVVCPDSVITDFPVGFTREGFGSRVIERRELIEKSLISSKKIITYSNYVKKEQLVARFAISEEKISVIPHGCISLSNSLNLLRPFDDLTCNEKRNICLQIVHDYLNNPTNPQYLKNFNFSGVKFLFYTSQIRPSKNIQSLIKAYRKVLINKNEPVKLILTGHPDAPYIQRLISDFGLSRDVIFLPNLPTQVMAALYHLSYLAINPTLFEGGFPFTFSEAYSVGTPSVMSRIPVVDEIITNPDLKKVMLFDPYNIDDIVERICWGLHHREELLTLEQPLYEQLKERSWAQVAREYWDVVDHINKQMEVKNEILWTI